MSVCVLCAWGGGLLILFKHLSNRIIALAVQMDRYHRVEKPRVETPIDENEIRITSQGRMRNYITYAMTLLQVSLFRCFS